MQVVVPGPAELVLLLVAELPVDLVVAGRRGGHVDRASLEEALKKEAIGGYAADTFWSEPADPNDPLLEDERILVTPHMGGKSAESIYRCANAVYENVSRFERGEALQNVVNLQPA